MFVDKAKVTLQAGSGGDGITSFRRERFISRGGPDGGDGGDGGDIIIMASNNENTLAAFRHNKLLKAGNGGAGGKRKRHGKRGENLRVTLPVGTVVYGTEGELLADLSENGQTEILASGGKGGFGNAHFTSSTRQAPRVSERGERGEKLDATLELKMIADAGLVGLPNAGKSTLLSVISNAHPEIADYPFTTIRPNLGVVDIDGSASLLVADIPGLIEGASEGKGLGDEFLRHVERTSVLVHLIDIYGENIVKDYKTIMSELAAYAVDLSKRPQVVVLTKTEGYDSKQLEAKIAEIKKSVRRGTPVLAISAASKTGLQELLRTVLKMVAKQRELAKAQRAELPVITLEEDENLWAVEESEGKYVVKGKKIERFAQRTKFGEAAAEQRLYDILGKMGIIKELEKRGIKSRQTIIIGDPEVGRLKY